MYKRRTLPGDDEGFIQLLRMAHLQSLLDHHAVLMQGESERNQSANSTAPESSLLVPKLTYIFPESSALIEEWFKKRSASVLPRVAGGDGKIDCRIPSPMVASTLVGLGKASWQSWRFSHASEANVYQISGNRNDAADAVKFKDGCVVVDLEHFPKDALWRAYYLAKEDPVGCGEDERELMLLSRIAVDQDNNVDEKDADRRTIQLIAQGRVLDAWQEAAAMEEVRLKAAVLMILTEMLALTKQAKNEVAATLFDQRLADSLACDLVSSQNLLDSLRGPLFENLLKQDDGKG